MSGSRPTRTTTATSSPAYIDTRPDGAGGSARSRSSTPRRRIGQTGRIYYNTLLDENAAAHIAFGSGFGGDAVGDAGARSNRSTIHLDVMIGGPDLEVTGFDARGRRIPLIHEGAWQI